MPGSTPKVDAALDLLATHRGVLLAVSGGPDSVALMIACAHWRGRARHDIAVATVDHGLREESRQEAEQVATWARDLGYCHHLLTWSGDKPRTRLQERARDARYALLADCAERIGATAIVTGHHAGDQAETILFRLTRGSGVAGLAGMQPASSWRNIALLRPLLRHSKEELEAICAQASHQFIRDPSNLSERFARVRLRALAPILSEQGLDRDALLRLGDRAAQADRALEYYASEALSRALLCDSAGKVTLDAERLRGAPLETLQRVIGLGLTRINPDQPVRLERLERAAQRIAQALAERASARLTLAGVLVDLEESELSLTVAPPRRTGV